MKKLLKLATACALLALPALIPASAEATKCAKCSDQHQACIAFCGSNQINFSCQNSNPCAGTCSCQ